MAPELLRICSLIVADNKIPPGEGASTRWGLGMAENSRAQSTWGIKGLSPVFLGKLSLCSLPDTKTALLLLLTFLAKQHADSFHTALGLLSAEKAQELQALLSYT